ncbi:MAG: hypothetical protein A2285_00610 [Elusimicrobia bacterium RIFOXYA12_FULL_57_11]|nr:MAG: hypothetical protein A2285_00610 [Elusimicrobia bacterium RIFOXYA12_FULL_57_11]
MNHDNPVKALPAGGPVSPGNALARALALLEKSRPFLSSALLACGVAISLSALFLPVLNPDLHWHFSAARWILAHHRLPAEDFLSWTMEGRPWIDFEWATQLLFYGTYRLGGFWALIVLKALIVSTALFSFAKLMRLYGLEKFLFLTLPLLTACLLPSLDVRPENFTMAFFAAEVYWLEKFRLKGLPANLPALLAAAMLFFAAWANLHAGFAYGLLLLAMYAFGEFLPAALPAVYGRGKFLPLAKTFRLCACLAAGAAGTLLNAYGWEIYSVLFHHLAVITDLQEYLQEWHGASIYTAYQRPYWALTAVAFAVMLRRFLKTRDIPYAHLCAVLYFSLSSANHARNTFFMALTAMPFTLYLLSLEQWTGKKRLAARAVMLAAALFMLTHFQTNVWSRLGKQWDALYAPQGAVDFLKRNTAQLSPLRMYNHWGWGGYLGYMLYPDYKLFVDGRYIFHPYLEGQTLDVHDPARWKRMAAEYGIELAVIKRPPEYMIVTKQPDGTNSLQFTKPEHTLVLPVKDWAMVYWDAQALVFVKRGRPGEKWLREHEFRILRAGELPNAEMKVWQGEVSLAEIKRELCRYLKGPRGQGNFNRGYEVGQWYRNLLKMPPRKAVKNQVKK